MACNSLKVSLVTLFIFAMILSPTTLLCKAATVLEPVPAPGPGGPAPTVPAPGPGGPAPTLPPPHPRIPFPACPRCLCCAPPPAPGKCCPCFCPRPRPYPLSAPPPTNY